jgi:hypothetical protein
VISCKTDFAIYDYAEETILNAYKMLFPQLERLVVH